MGTDVRPCGYDDIRPLGTTLAQAFSDDPVFRYLVPNVDDGDRARRLVPFFAATVRVHRNLGEVWTNPDVVAGSLWVPPGRHIPEWRQLGAGIAFMRAALRSVPRGMRFLNAMKREHPTGTPHWYLAVLGTAPGHQGKGHGAAAMAPVLERCDREGVPAYLESSKESNVPFYERYGFRVQRELTPDPDGPTMWAMWREPQ